MGRLAWTALELAPKLGISPLNTRRYLRRYAFAGRLTRKKFGRIWYYAVTRFLSPPNFSYPCPFCNGRMDVYQVKCGCEFQICSQVFEHSVFKYCEKHQGTVPRFRKVQATCALCGTSETLRVDSKSNEIVSNWQYFEKLTLPDGRKVDYWECPKCAKSWEKEEEALVSANTRKVTAHFSPS
jgi:ssDNA-binding Zn-finger/Zn-ribbon topoisomerase 1